MNGQVLDSNFWSMVALKLGHDPQKLINDPGSFDVYEVDAAGAFNAALASDSGAMEWSGITRFEQGLSRFLLQQAYPGYVEQMVKEIDRVSAKIENGIEAKQSKLTNEQVERAASSVKKCREKLGLICLPGPQDQSALISLVHETICGRARRLCEDIAKVLPHSDVIELARAIEAGPSEEVRIAVIGRFNAGKSTLINRLLARAEPLLHTNDLTETGTSILVRRGNESRAIARTSSGERHAVALTPEALSEWAGLRGADGLSRAPNQIAERVEIALTDACLPEDVVLIDSPGLDDKHEMDERVLAIAASADQVIFLLRSDQFLAEKEGTLLRDVLSNRDPASVHLAINWHTTEPSEEKWQSFLEKTLAVHRQRLGERGNAIGLNGYHFDRLAAEFAANQGGNFEAPSLRQGLEAIINQGRRTRAAQREAQLESRLREIKKKLLGKVKSLREAIENVRKAIQFDQAMLEAREKFKREITLLLDLAHAHFAEAAG